MFGNIGFMGIPIIAALFPEQGMLYIALFTVIDQLLLWTLGVNLTTPVDRENTMSVISRLMKMINPATIAIILSILGLFIGLHLPEPINAALTKAGLLTPPMALITWAACSATSTSPSTSERKKSMAPSRQDVPLPARLL